MNTANNTTANLTNRTGSRRASKTDGSYIKAKRGNQTKEVIEITSTIISRGKSQIRSRSQGFKR